jgi:hypothetical protein
MDTIVNDSLGQLTPIIGQSGVMETAVRPSTSPKPKGVMTMGEKTATYTPKHAPVTPPPMPSSVPSDIPPPPTGFVLDQKIDQGNIPSPPEGFVLDSKPVLPQEPIQPPETPFQSFRKQFAKSAEMTAGSAFSGIALSALNAAKGIADLNAKIPTPQFMQNIKEKTGITALEEKARGHVDNLIQDFGAYREDLHKQIRQEGGIAAEVAQNIGDSALETATMLATLGVSGFTGTGATTRAAVREAAKFGSLMASTTPGTAKDRLAAGAHAAAMMLLPIPASKLPYTWMAKAANILGLNALSAISGDYSVQKAKEKATAAGHPEHWMAEWIGEGLPPFVINAVFGSLVKSAKTGNKEAQRQIANIPPEIQPIIEQTQRQMDVAASKGEIPLEMQKPPETAPLTTEKRATMPLEGVKTGEPISTIPPITEQTISKWIDENYELSPQERTEVIQRLPEHLSKVKQAIADIDIISKSRAERIKNRPDNATRRERPEVYEQWKKENASEFLKEEEQLRTIESRFPKDVYFRAESSGSVVDSDSIYVNVESPVVEDTLLSKYRISQHGVTKELPNIFKSTLPPSAPTTQKATEEVAETPVSGTPETTGIPTKREAGLGAYFNEQINYGGEIRSRGSVIAEMQKQGIPQKQIDAYMIGAKAEPISIAEKPTKEELISKFTKQGYKGTALEAKVAKEEAKSLGAAAADRLGIVTKAFAEPGEQRLRGLLETAKRSPKVSETAKKELGKLEPEYEQQKTSDMEKRVLDWFTEDKRPTEIASKVAEAEIHVRNPEADLDTKGAVGIALLEHYKATGNDAASVALIDHLDPLLRGAGRAIQAARLMNKLTGNGWVQKMNKYLADRNVKLPDGIRKEVEQGFLDAAKIKDETARQEAIHNVIAKIATYVPFKLGEWVDAYRYTNMLSNPQSHERNIYGNLVQTLITRPLTLASRGNFKGAGKYFANTWRNGLSGKAFSVAKESFNYDFGKWAEALDDPNATIFDAIRREQGPQGKGQRIAWKTLTFIPKLLNAQDVFFGSLIEAGETARLVKEGKSAELAQQIARHLSDKYLYRDKFGTRRDKSLSIASQAIDGLANLMEKGRTIENPYVRWPMKLVVPFLRTPMRIAQFSAEASPLGWLGSGLNTEKIAQARYNKSFERLTENEQTIVKEDLNNRIGLASIGSMVTLWGVGMALQGRTTWGPPQDEKAKELFYASGRRPYSFEVGGKWIPMAYLGPFFLAFAMPAAARDAFADNPTLVDENFLTKLGTSAMGIPKILLSQTPVAGMNGLLEALQGKIDKNIASAVGFEGAQFIPTSGLLRWMNKIVDPTYRKPVSIMETIQSGIPGLSKDVEAYQEMEGGDAQRPWTDIYLPYTVGKQDEDIEDIFQYRKKKLKLQAERRGLKKEAEREARRERNNFSLRNKQ